MLKDYSNEGTLLAGINRNEPGAWEFLRGYCSEAVRRYVRHNKGSDEDASDILSEGITALAEKVSEEKLVMSAKVSTLLIKICKNQWKDVLKSQDSHRRNARKLYEAPLYTQEEEMDRAVFRDVAMRCFSRLEELCQKIFKMILEEKEYKEIGAHLGLSPAYIKKRKHLCHKEWIRLIKSHPGYLNPTDHQLSELI